MFLLYWLANSCEVIMSDQACFLHPFQNAFDVFTNAIFSLHTPLQWYLAASHRTYPCWHWSVLNPDIPFLNSCKKIFENFPACSLSKCSTSYRAIAAKIVAFLVRCIATYNSCRFSWIGPSPSSSLEERPTFCNEQLLILAPCPISPRWDVYPAPHI